METPLSEQIIALIVTCAALTVAGCVVWAARTWGVQMTAAYLVMFLGTFVVLRWIFGMSVKVRTATADDEGDDES